MNEALAPEAERVAADIARQEGRCRIAVKLYEDGSYVISGLEVDGMPIHEFLQMNKTGDTGTLEAGDAPAEPSP